MRLPVSSIGGAIVIYLVITLFLACGWVMNIVKLASCDFEASYKAEVIRGLGVIAAPVGGVVGWLTINDTPK